MRFNGEQAAFRLGNFDLRDKNQRPDETQDGGEIPISARRVVTFRPVKIEGASRGLCWNQEQ
jgi:nucleoid DNA-binding protein